MRRSLRVPGGNGDEASSLALERMLAAPISDVCFPTPTDEVRAVFKVNNVGGPVTVNGNPSEWDTSVDGPDFVTYMYNSGNADSFAGFEEAAMLFLRWDCTQKKLCALVLTKPNNCISNSATWFKDYSTGSNSEVTAVSPGIELVSGTGGNYVGWEGTRPELLLYHPCTVSRHHGLVASIRGASLTPRRLVLQVASNPTAPSRSTPPGAGTRWSSTRSTGFAPGRIGRKQPRRVVPTISLVSTCRVH